MPTIRAGDETAGPGVATSTFDAFYRQHHRAVVGLAYSDDAAADAVPIEQFLRERRGSAEQFASAFAVMARSLGIPARVVAGFLPGELGPDGHYHVRRADTHAWAEVWFEGAGWVPFDPSPRPGTTATP
jgi:hypothetical protein